MKKIFSLILFVLLFSNCALAQDNFDYSQYCTQKNKSIITVNDKTAVKRFFKNALLFANTQQADKLYNLYSTNYVSTDGFNRDIYFDLIKKTYEKYPNIKHKFNIKQIYINGDTAIVEVEEIAKATSYEMLEQQKIQGALDSFASVTYYLQKEREGWKFIADDIMFEQTKLMYGDAIETKVEFIAPNQTTSGKEYTASLKVTPPSKSFVIGSITQESITYPQISSEEIFKKLPPDGILERMFTANKKNLNEYNIASIGLTKVRCNNNINTVYVTGLGYIINRINIKPVNTAIKVSDNGEIKE